MDIGIARLHNEVPCRGRNGEFANELVDAWVFFFFFFDACGAHAVRGRSARSKKKTVGRFSFCGLLAARSLILSRVSLFRVGGGSGSERYPSAMYRSSSIILSKKFSGEWWALSLTVVRQSVPSASTSRGMIILSISRAIVSLRRDLSDVCIGVGEYRSWHSSILTLQLSQKRK